MAQQSSPLGLPLDDDGRLAATIELSEAGWERKRDAKLQKYREYVNQVGTYEEHLRAAAQSLSMGQKLQFEEGDLVQWKSFLKDAYLPEYGNPAVVLEIIDVPLQTDTDGDRLALPHDLILGVLTGDQELHAFSASSRRLVSWESSGADDAPHVGLE